MALDTPIAVIRDTTDTATIEPKEPGEIRALFFEVSHASGATLPAFSVQDLAVRDSHGFGGTSSVVKFASHTRHGRSWNVAEFR